MQVGVSVGSGCYEPSWSELEPSANWLEPARAKLERVRGLVVLFQRRWPSRLEQNSSGCLIWVQAYSLLPLVTFSTTAEQFYTNYISLDRVIYYIPNGTKIWVNGKRWRLPKISSFRGKSCDMIASSPTLMRLYVAVLIQNGINCYKNSFSVMLITYSGRFCKKIAHWHGLILKDNSFWTPVQNVPWSPLFLVYVKYTRCSIGINNSFL
jgi:hypothetical protein